jgi:hypothetical protein
LFALRQTGSGWRKPDFAVRPPMQLPASLAACGKADFESVFKHEVERLDHAELPLQQGLAHSSQVAASAFAVMVLKVRCDPAVIRVRAGIFYAGVVAGCNCADDPTPTEENREYCEVQFAIDRATATATLTLLG